MGGDETTRRRVLAAGGVLGTLGLSGCLRLTNSETDEQTTRRTTTGSPDTTTATTTRTETTTEATETATETEESTETATEPEYPPGMSEDEVSATLVQVHAGELAGRPHTVTTEAMGQVQIARIGENAVLAETVDGSDVYVTDGEMYQRRTVDGQTIYGYRDEVLDDFRRPVFTGESLLRALLRGGNFRPVGTQTRNGDQFFLIEADDVVDQEALRRSDRVSLYFRESEFPIQRLSGTGVVSPSGRIDELEVFLEGDGDGGTFAVSTSDVGSTDVSKPSWADTAVEQEAQFEASLVDGGDYIRVEQVSGQTIDATSRTGFEIDAYVEREYYDGRFTGTTSTGTVLYLYRTDEQTRFGTPKLGISKGSRPSSSPAASWGSTANFNIRIRDIRVVENREVT